MKKLKQSERKFEVALELIESNNAVQAKEIVQLKKKLDELGS